MESIKTAADQPDTKLKELRIRIISDVICPWCYIGKRRLEAALRSLPRDVAPKITWSAFELNPDMPARGMERKAYRSAKFGNWERSEAMDAEIANVGESEGLAFHFARIKRTPNTFAAHRLIWFAKRFGKQNDIVEELFRRYFVAGEDVGDPEVLIAAANECKMPSGLAREFLSGDEGSAEVAQESARARRDGISGVPTFILNEVLAVSGAQRPEAFAAAFRRASTEL